MKSSYVNYQCVVAGGGNDVPAFIKPYLPRHVTYCNTTWTKFHGSIRLNPIITLWHLVLPATKTSNDATFAYFQIDTNGDGFIDLKELREALDVCGFKIPGYKVRQIEDELKTKQCNNGKMSYGDFEALCEELKANEIGHTYKKVSYTRHSFLSNWTLFAQLDEL